MFYNLFFSWSKSVGELYDFIESNTEFDNCIVEGDNKRYVTQDYTLRLNESKQTIHFKNEDYHQDFSVLLVFEVIPNSKWATKLLEFAGKLMKVNEGACLIESNGDTPILYRETDKIVVDDSKLNGKGMPFEELSLKYTRYELERI